MRTKWANCAAPIIRLPISTLGEKEAVLMEPWTIYWVAGFADIVIPAGATTDGASIPRFLWRVCGHPLQSPRVYAALAHDWLYRNGWRFGITRKEADRIYRALLRHFGVSAWRAAVEYRALRWFGARHYNSGSSGSSGTSGFSGSSGSSGIRRLE